MRKDMIQSKAFRLIGTIIIPGLLFLPLLLMRSVEDNYTGFLASQEYSVQAHILFFFLACWLYASLKHRCGNIFFGFILMAAAALLIPYQVSKPLLLNLHLLSAYAAFVLFQMVLWQVYKHDSHFLFQYSIILFTVFLITISYGQITGIAEAIYASGVSILICNHY